MCVVSARNNTPFQRALNGVLTVTLVVSQLALPAQPASAALGSSTASAGSAPPPAATAIQSFQPDLFTGRATTSIPIAVPPGRKGMQWEEEDWVDEDATAHRGADD